MEVKDRYISNLAEISVEQEVEIANEKQSSRLKRIAVLGANVLRRLRDDAL